MTKTPATPSRGSFAGRAWLIGAVVAVVAVTGVLLASRGDGGGGGSQIGHVHGLGINPADGSLRVAAHNGVFRLPAGGPAERVGDGAQDTMGFTIAGPDRFLGSGHPAPLEGGPDQLGLIESTDGGLTWQTLSLAGEADFHALRYRHDIVYGYNAVTGQLLVSPDGVEWQHRSSLELADLAVSPVDPELILATTRDGVIRSTDGGRSWTPAGGPPVVLLAWETDDRLWGVTGSGEVLHSSDGGARWSGTGTAPGAPTAFAAQDDDLYLAVLDQGILHSGDAGANWNRLHP